MRQIAMVAFVVLAAGCASKTKKQCQKTNWFEHGKSVAMQGKRLDEDSFVKACEREEVFPNSGELDSGFKAGMQQYCRPEVVYQTGKSGEFFNPDLCDPSKERALKANHHKGVQVFCEAPNGYEMGAKGWVYNKICPANQERAFLSEYRKGRKVYLGHEITDRESEIKEIDQRIAGYESEKRRLTAEIATMPRGEVVSYERVYDPVTKSYKQVIKRGEDESVKSRRESLQRDISRLNRDIRNGRNKQSDLRGEITRMRQEVSALN